MYVLWIRFYHPENIKRPIDKNGERLSFSISVLVFWDFRI